FLLADGSVGGIEQAWAQTSGQPPFPADASWPRCRGSIARNVSFLQACMKSSRRSATVAADNNDRLAYASTSILQQRPEQTSATTHRVAAEARRRGPDSGGGLGGGHRVGPCPWGRACGTNAASGFLQAARALAATLG